MSAVIENHHEDHDHGPAKGITRWLYTTNHKDIGTLYLWFSFAMFLIGGAMAMIIRAELFPVSYTHLTLPTMYTV